MDETLRKRLAALRATAQGRGTTEAEAMAAAEKMAQIMREHGLDDDDIDYVQAEAPLKTRRPTARTTLLGTISVCTNCSATLKSDWTPCVVYIGKAPGPEIATYLTAVCNRAIDRAIDDFKMTIEYRRRRTLSTQRKAVEDFTMGIVWRLEMRLYDMFKDGIDDDARARANQARDGRMATADVTMPARKVRFGDAARAGNAAARNVQLAPGVNGDRPVRQIGRG